jgi:hypothetical protein
MSRARRRDQFGPPLALLGIALLLTAAIPVVGIAAGRQSPLPVACPEAMDLIAARDRQVSAGRTKPRLSAVLSQTGELTGQTLSLDTVVGAVTIEMPAEAFVGKAQGDLLVYTTHAAALGSAVHLVDLATGCDTVAATPAHIVRSAVLDPSASALYVHSVSKAGRRDNGVARLDLASGISTTVVPPLAPNEEFGPTFGTQLAWSVDGAGLAVQSCGFVACRTRVLDVATGAITTFDKRGQGALIVLSKRHLVTYGECLGLPCPALSFDLATGAEETLAEAAFAVVAGPASDGRATLSIETAGGKSEVVQ